MPKNPKNVEEFLDAFNKKDILEDFGYAYNKQKEKDVFFNGAVDTGEFSYCVFSSRKIINLMNERIKKNNLDILMDATLRTCAFGPFKQLLIMYVRVHHQVSILVTNT